MLIVHFVLLTLYFIPQQLTADCNSIPCSFPADFLLSSARGGSGRTWVGRRKKVWVYFPCFLSASLQLYLCPFMSQQLLGSRSYSFISYWAPVTLSPSHARQPRCGVTFTCLGLRRPHHPSVLPTPLSMVPSLASLHFSNRGGILFSDGAFLDP